MENGFKKEGFPQFQQLKKKESNQEFENLIKEIERYTSAICNNGETQPRKWNHKNKYRTNFKPSF
ncbi:MAG: hypothetical protein HFJ40_04530 [Clostridia bacterium]|nr:hypothetical protein [Clostridia bacterium]